MTAESGYQLGHGYSTALLARSSSDLCQPNIISHVGKCIYFYSYSSCNLRSDQPGSITQQHRPKQPARSKVGVKQKRTHGGRQSAHAYPTINGV